METRYEEIYNSFVNGKYKQGKKQIKALSLRERQSFYYYIKDTFEDKCMLEEIVVIMITRDF